MKQVLQKALFDAGAILLESFGKIREYEEKESQSSIVTKTDIESENKILEVISRLFPEHNFLGEESGFRNRQSRYTWVVDPLDGTSNFAAGIPWFGVIICLLKDFEPEMAGCFLPVQGQFYFAEKGQGAFKNEKRIHISEESTLRNILMAYSLDYSDEAGKTETEARLIGELVKRIRNLRSTNCLIDLCYTADGRLGASANKTTKIWDIAGPALLIQEAGGKVTDFSGKDLNFRVDETDYNRNFEIVASNPRLHPQLIQLINRM